MAMSNRTCAPCVVTLFAIFAITGQAFGATINVPVDQPTIQAGINAAVSDADGADNTFGTADDDLRLPAGSPCSDSADSSAYTGPIADLGGLDRTVDDPSTVDTGTGTLTYQDMGAHEAPAVVSAASQADLDDDGDVDGNDFLTFSNCFNGSTNPPNYA